MYDLLEADAIVAEVNQGGDMVRSVIHAIRPGLKVIKVRAKRGKHLRAEPVSALYALNRIKHVGNFPELERQMCLMTAEGYEGKDSPDNVDACVYVFLELFNKLARKQIPDSLRPVRATNQYRPHDGLNRGSKVAR
jgi:phage terminase large subunit-like protein